MTRDAELDRVRTTLLRGGTLSKELLGTEYRVAREALAEGQFLKCCYCEDRLQDVRWEHVEHFRPKVRYWWLTWTWDNLLFSCIRCNHAKAEEFPLLAGSVALAAEQAPPGSERPALIDPASEDPRQHIQFRPFGEHWIPGPRTPRGAAMLEAVGLGPSSDRHPPPRVGLQQEWDDHARRLDPLVGEIHRAIESNEAGRVRAAWSRTEAFRVSSQRFVALALDVLDHHIPEHVRSRWALALDVLAPSR
ncbi:MAG: hypothetical protein AB1Z98_00180 [Nannocystaceae bacterium]